ncbi:MAG: ABC transporter ATP-binding protein [Pleomorphochaeta sp.]
MEKKEILRVENLKKYFHTPNGVLHAVDDINFSLKEGTTLGVVGESGCGKSTLGRTILRLHEPTSGKIYFDGKEINNYSKKEMKEVRKDMQIIFQDPFASLNPRMTIGQTIAESLLIQKMVKKNSIELENKIVELMDLVGLASRLRNAFPHELDGGRRQRVGIARVLALNPKFIVCDEPVSALDVSIQAQVLNLMQDLQDEFGFTYLFITHDLSVVRHLSDEIMVMYLGQMVEKAPANLLFSNPIHPYTKALLSAIPVPDPDFNPERIILKGEITSPIDPEPGCRFCKRCIKAIPACMDGDIPIVEVEPNHFVVCKNY